MRNWQDKGKKGVGILLLLLSINLNAQISIEAPRLSSEVGFFQVNDEVWEADKQLHVAGSIFLGFAFKCLYTDLGLNEAWSSALAWGSVMVLGTIKEATDKTGFDFNDMASNGAGAALGVFSASVIIDINFNKNPKKR